MESKLSPFEVLQLSEQSSADQIRERYLLMSRTFHPDKQPLENWNLTKKYFQNIDKAYKSISTELRKYIFFKFEIDGIDLLDRYPDEFATMEGKQATPQGQQEIDQMIFHFYFSDRRDYLDDQGFVQSNILIDISPLFQKFTQGTPPPTYNLPTISKIQSGYILNGPTILGFQNNIAFQYNSLHNKRFIGCAVTSAMRIFRNLLFKNTLAVGVDHLQVVSVFEYFHSPTLLVRFTPIIYSNAFSIPSIQIQKRLDNGLVFTAESNLQTTSFQLYSPGKNPDSISTNYTIAYSDNSLESHINLNIPFSDFCKFMIQLHQQYSGKTIQVGLSYGISVDVSEDTRVTILSHFSNNNFLEFKIVSGKYNMRLPIICNSLQSVQFQALKLSTMLVFYTTIRLLHYFRRNNSLKKEKLKLKSYSRLNDEESKNKVSIAEISSMQSQILKFQQRTQGLVILSAYVGNEKQIYKISRKIWKKRLNVKAAPSSSIRSQLVFTNEQVVDVTKKVQLLVKGARIEGKVLRIYNPCYDQTEKPILYIYYVLRGKVHSMIQSAQKQINIGLERVKYQNFLTRGINWLKKMHVIA